jgi:hypothetical protein
MAGFIAPWSVDKQVAGDFLLSKFQLREGNAAVEVSEQGLYYIYAQVRTWTFRFYINHEPHLCHKYNRVIL